MNMTGMSRGLYKTTMTRTTERSGETHRLPQKIDAAARRPPEDKPPPGPSERTPPSERMPGPARPLIGQRTIYVDRQVARRVRSRSKGGKLRNYKLLAVVLTMAAVAALMAWLVVLTKLEIAQTRASELDAELRRAEREIDDLRSALVQRESDLAALVENRIPGMKPLEFNKLLDVMEDYVVNVSFAESGVDESKKLEYHAMLRNDTTGVIDPQVTIYLFDQYGLEVGAASLEKDDATQDYVLAELRPGETRSYHEPIEVKRSAVPVYFMVHID